MLAFSYLAGVLLCGQPNLPENLPKPPPLPPEILKRKPPTPPPDLPDPSELMEQLRQLEELLSMTPEQLRKLRETVEIIENKSPAEREAMRIRLRQVTQMTDALRTEIASFRQIAPSLSNSDLTQYWLSLEREQRESAREVMRDLSRENKRAFLLEAVSSFVERRDELFSEMRKNLPDRRPAPSE